MTSPNQPLKYDANFDPTDRNDSHALMLRLIGRAPRVLDLGCATGTLGRILRERGSYVVGIDSDQDAARLASEVLDEVIVADLESGTLPEQLGSERFDAVLFGD